MSRQLCPHAPWALHCCGDTQRDGGLGLVPSSCRLPGEVRRPPRPGSGLRFLQLWQGEGPLRWLPGPLPCRGTRGTHLAQFPHSTALGGSHRGGHSGLSLGPGPRRQRSHPLCPCCWPRGPSLPAWGKRRPVVALTAGQPDPHSSHQGSLLETASGCLSPTLGKPERALPRAKHPRGAPSRALPSPRCPLIPAGPGGRFWGLTG